MKKKIIALSLLLAPVMALAASTFTEHFDLEKPGDGDTFWGPAIRDSFDTIDTQLYVNQSGIADHIADTVGAHAASAISAAPGSSYCTLADDVAEYLDCLDDRIALLAPLASPTFTGTVTGTFSGNLTGNVTGNASTATLASTVTTNANLNGDVTSIGNTTSISPGVIVNSDISSSAAIEDSKLGTIQTSGKVSNSATTATSANTASAIVARDASGNFSAGTITASALSGPLTGSVTGNVTGNLTGNVTGNASGSAAAFTGNLTGDVTSVGMTTTIPVGTVTNDMLAGSIDLATKVTGNLDVSHLDGGAGASSSTYWRGDGVWGTPAGGGDVSGPGSSVNGEVALFDGASGQLIKRATGTGVPVLADGVLSVSSVSGSTLAFLDATSSVQTQIDGKQASDTDLTAVAGLASNGIVTRTGSGSAAARTITGTASQVTVTNGDGVSGNPTLSLPATINVNTSGNAATATALAANPADCAADTYATTINASGTLTCSTVTNAGLAGSIADSKLSTISTAGKVSNSATTATNLNTASAIVARDASGNFSAGTITAALSGNASTATALAANPTDCAADTYATAINASGTLSCGTVTNAGLAGSIAYSKLVLTGSVTNADLAGSIADSKLSQITTASKVSTSAITGTLGASNGGSGVSNSGTFTWGSNNITVTTTGTTSVTLPTAGSLISSEASSAERVERANINLTSGGCTISSQSGSWLSSCTRNALGDATLTIAASRFSSTPQCFITLAPGASGRESPAIVTATTTSLRVQFENSASTRVDDPFNVFCMGTK